MNFRILWCLFKGYLIAPREKRHLLVKIFQSLLFFATFIFIINAVGYGIFHTMQNMVVDYYGDIQIIFKKKISEKELVGFKKKLEKLPIDVMEYFFYGISYGMVSVGKNSTRPIYLLTYTGNCSRIFLNKVLMNVEDKFICGKNLFSLLKEKIKVNIFLLRSIERKKKNISYDSFPINLSGYATFLSDEWNDKVILVSNKIFEKYFERKNIEYLQLYIDKKKDKKKIMKIIMDACGSMILSIKDGADISIESEIFFSFLRMSVHLIILLLFVLSFFFIYFFMKMYLYENKVDYYFLRIVGVSETDLYLSYIFLLQCIVLSSVVIGFLFGSVIVFIINYYKIINFFYNNLLFFSCAIEKKILCTYFIVYLLYTFFLSHLLFYFCYKIEKK